MKRGMPSTRRRLPPLRSCFKCGREFRAWREADCPTCKPANREESSALGDELRRRRLARRAATDKIAREAVRE